jgi:hypothetical protein
MRAEKRKGDVCPSPFRDFLTRFLPKREMNDFNKN